MTDCRAQQRCFEVDLRPTLRAVQQRRLEHALRESFRRYADPTCTGHSPARPISLIDFCAPGETVAADDGQLEFIGFGKGREGVAFVATGGFGLSFLLDDKGVRGDYLPESQAFATACEMVTAALKAVGRSPEFRALPGDKAILFMLSLAEQGGCALGRLHRDGMWEDEPPKRW